MKHATQDGLQGVVRDAFLHQCDLQALTNVLSRLRAVPATQHHELIDGCSRVSGEPEAKESLQQSTLPSCGSWLAPVQQSPPYDPTLSVTRVPQQLLRTLLAHQDQRAVQLSTESSRVRDVAGFAPNQQILQATVDGSTVSYELELERSPTRLSPIERHWFAQ